MSKKTYEHQQIKQILAEAATEGDKAVRAKYKLSNATLAVWRRKQAGVQVVSKASKAKADPERQRLLAENERLRSILGAKLLDEVLKS